MEDLETRIEKAMETIEQCNAKIIEANALLLKAGTDAEKDACKRMISKAGYTKQYAEQVLNHLLDEMPIETILKFY